MSHQRSDGPTRIVTQRWTDAELGRVDAAAAAAGLNRSDYIRRLVLNGGATTTARCVGTDGDGRRVWDDGGPLLTEGTDCETLPEDPMVSDDWRTALTDPNQPDPLLAANGGDGAWGKETP